MIEGNSTTCFYSAVLKNTHKSKKTSHTLTNNKNNDNQNKGNKKKTKEKK